MKKYLLNGIAALTIGLSITSCMKEFNVEEQREQQALNNAEQALGFRIPEDQAWTMTTKGSINLTIPGNSNETYTVYVYANDPTTDGTAYYLLKQTVKGGDNLVAELEIPDYKKSFVVGIADSDGLISFKYANVKDGVIDTWAEVARTRAIASTRSNQGADYPATSTGINANANEWADPDKEFGGWIVPTPLTDDQKLRVRMYFQANPNLGYQDPELRHFFVQQVYKGGSAQAGSSSENITAANGSVYNSNNMNLLTVGANHQHINNYNAGDCSVSNNVLDNGGNVNDGPYHSDKIMLMVNIDDTSCFGYHETGSSNHHDNKAALVSAATIDAWAAENGNPGEAVTDKWNRSFLGFDLAIAEGEQAYAKDDAGNVIYATYDQAAESPKYAWDGEKIVEIADPTKYYPIEYYDGYKTIMGCGWLTTNTNFYVAADKFTLPQTVSMNRAQASTISTIQNAPVLKDVMVGDTYYQSIINLPRIKQLVEKGYLPVKDKSLTEWVKVGKSDGYFTDWIVTLTEGKRQTKSEALIWSYAFEDSNLKSDYDMNDVVIKVQETADQQHLKVTLAAAGCQYDNVVYLGETAIEWQEGVTEVHEAFGVGKGVMVNTGRGVDANPVTITIDKPVNYYPATADWSIVPSGGDSKDQHIGIAETGKNPCGIRIPYDWAWPIERTNICNAYNDFATWAAEVNEATRKDVSDWYERPTSNLVRK